MSVVVWMELGWKLWFTTVVVFDNLMDFVELNSKMVISYCSLVQISHSEEALPSFIFLYSLLIGRHGKKITT